MPSDNPNRNSIDSEHQKVLLVIPAYNEEESILRVAQIVEDSGYDYVVINDGSSDATFEICKSNDIPVLNLSANLGIGGAIQCGHMYAYEKGYDIDIQFDGDGQHDINSVQKLIDGINNGADLVIGSRFIEKTSDNFASTGMRRLGIRWLSGTIKFMTNRRIYDVTSGFRACSRSAMRLFSVDYPIDYPEPESIVTAIKHHLKVDEVPVKMNERLGGRSSIRALSSVYYMIKVTLAILIQGFTRHGRIKNRNDVG